MVTVNTKDKKIATVRGMEVVGGREGMRGSKSLTI